MGDPIRLEGFSATLKGQRLWVCGKAHTLGHQIVGRLAVLEEELLGRGRTVLFTYNTRDIAMRWSQKIKWDATFRIRESQDLRIAAQWCQAALKPLRVVWVGDEPPAAFLAAIAHPEITVIVASMANPKTPYSAIFWEPSTEQKLIEEGLVPRMGASGVHQLNLATVLHELRVSNVGLVWSAINESDKSGSIYWYDGDEAAQATQGHTLDLVEASEVLRDVATFLQSQK